MKKQPSGLTLYAYPGDANILLAWDLDEHQTVNLAGFAIECKPPKGPAYVVTNRLSFKTNFTSDTTAAQRVWTPSTEAPVQRFSWLDYLKSDDPGDYTYKVTAMYFDGPPKGGTSPANASDSGDGVHARVFVVAGVRRAVS